MHAVASRRRSPGGAAGKSKAVKLRRICCVSPVSGNSPFCKTKVAKKERQAKELQTLTKAKERGNDGTEPFL